MPKVTSKTAATAENNNDTSLEVIKMLQEQLAAMKKELAALKTEKPEKVSAPVTSVENVEEDYDEPSPNKQIRIMSLYYGNLNLSTEPFGKGKLISFNKYGETKTMLYSTLIDIVNNHRNFAEKGYFYILDKSAVYYLGLSDSYRNLMSKDMMDDIYSYPDVDIEKILKNATDEQKETLIYNTAKSIYDGKRIDLNKCSIIEKVCGININDKVNEMRSFGQK